jgi:ribosomal protein S6
VKRYEGLFILNPASTAKEDGLKEVIDKISAEITSAGGKVETVQKMDKKNFTRVADRKNTSGYYVNVIFEGESKVVSQLNHRFGTNDDVFRVLFTSAPLPKVAAAK